MSTLVYSPGIQILIATARKGILDISDDIESGSITLNENAPHSLSVRIENPRRKYDGVFIPNDRIIVRMKRIRWVQVFAGYLNKVPLTSVWPRTVNLSASCTLKKLLYTQYDQGAVATTDLFRQADLAQSDGNLSNRASLALTEIAKWDAKKIHIGRLPDQWFESVQTLYAKISPSLQPSADALAFIGNAPLIAGSESANVPTGASVNANANDPSIMGPPTLTANDIVTWWGNRAQPQVASVQQLANWYLLIGASEGVRGDLAFAQSCVETGYFTNGPSKRDNNFAGIAHYDGQSRGSGFDSPQQGITAQIQLLKKVALGNEVQLANPDVSPNWGGRQAGTLAGLAGNWATATNYATIVGGVFRDMLGTKTLKGSTPTNGGDARLENMARDQAAGGTGTYVFPVPGGTWNKNSFGQPRASNGRTGAHIHQGVDISAPEGTPILAVCDQTITKVTFNSFSAGNWVKAVAPNGDEFRYLHMMDGGVLVTEGQQVKRGQQIGKVGATGAPNPTAYHLHFEYRPGGGAAVSPNSMLETGEQTAGTGPEPGMGGSMLNASKYFPGPQDISWLLSGPRALMNDTPLFDTVRDFIQSSMRSFCSAPNGDFIAWFPDYFGRYGKIGKMTIEPIELVDFTIDWDDRYMVTHQFVTGSINGWNGPVDPNETLSKMVTTMGIASIDFPEILEAIIGKVDGDWTDPAAILARFGARPNQQTMPAVTEHEAEFFFAMYLFARAWAQQFSARVPISFMPELWPGMLMKIPSQGLQVYVESLTHSFDFRDGGGFSTQVSISAPSSLDGRFIGLPKAGRIDPTALESRPPISNPNTRPTESSTIQGDDPANAPAGGH